jgi:DNA invertase Pin-like site-specific DNA recombinase
MRRAFSYKRISSLKQAKGDGLRRQSEFEEEICREMSLVLDDSLDLTDRGFSAFRGDNVKFGALARFLKLVEDGRVEKGSVLIVENIDRLTRENILDAFALFTRIINLGLTIVTKNPRDVYCRENVTTDLSKLMVPLVYMMRAHDESAMKSHRVHKAWDRRRERAKEDGRALTARCPDWLRVVSGRYEFVPERVEAVRFIFEQAREGLGVDRLIRALEAAGHQPFGRSGRWNDSYIKKLLKWPAVYGEWQPCRLVDGVKQKSGDPVSDYFPAAVTQEDFLLARAAIEGRRGKEGRPAKENVNLFSGLTYHAGDRDRMHLRVKNTRRYGSFAYLVSNQVRCGKGRECRSFPYGPFEAAVLQALAELRPQDLAERKQEGRGLEAVIQKLQTHVAVLDERYRQAEQQLLDPENTTPAAELNDRLNKLSKAKSEKAAELARLQTEAAACRADSLDEVQSILELLSKAAGPALEELKLRLKPRIRRLVNEIWVFVEKTNHVRSVAHVQLFLKSGARRYFVVHSKPCRHGELTPVEHDFTEVDLRQHPAGR